MVATPGRRTFDPSEYPHQELTREIIGAFYYVYHRLGYGFLESAYRRALVVELRFRGIPVAEEVPFEIRHREVTVATYRADVIVADRVIVEAKAGSIMDPAAASQLQSYLHATHLPIGLVLHFGPTPQIKRLIATRSRLDDFSSREIHEGEKRRAGSDGNGDSGHSLVRFCSRLFSLRLLRPLRTTGA